MRDVKAVDTVVVGEEAHVRGAVGVVVVGEVAVVRGGECRGCRGRYRCRKHACVDIVEQRHIGGGSGALAARCSRVTEGGVVSVQVGGVEGVGRIGHAIVLVLLVHVDHAAVEDRGEHGGGVCGVGARDGGEGLRDTVSGDGVDGGQGRCGLGEIFDAGNEGRQEAGETTGSWSRLCLHREGNVLVGQLGRGEFR